MTMNNRIYLDIHAIQTVPPSNINRDDTGSPKTAQYGGTRRARVSSQSWKKAMRKYFIDFAEKGKVGKRTLEIVRYVADKIISLEPEINDEEAMKLAEDIFKKAKIQTKDQKAKALFFLGDSQAQALAEAAIQGESDVKKIKEIITNNPAIDIALFGRMVADDPSLNEDASAQVAHSISTHAVQAEFDFYTAVDDFRPEDNVGAGMLGTIEYNSSTLYRYANIAVHELKHQLEDDQAVLSTIKLFVEAFIKSMPTGKINSFANHTLPQAILLVLRQDRPVNLVSAFEKPVRSSEGYVDASIKALFAEADLVKKFVDEPVAQYVLLINDEAVSTEGLALSDNIDDLENRILKDLEDRLNELEA